MRKTFILSLMIIFLQNYCEAADAVKLDLNCYAEKNTVKFVVIAENNTKGDIKLAFTSNQFYEIFIMNENKEIVWASSKGKMYAQVISEISLKPKEQKIFEETSNIDSGSYMVKAVLNIIPDRIETKWKKLNVAGVNEEQKRIIIGRVKVIMSNVYVFSDDKEIYMVGRPAKDMQLLNNGYIEIYDYEVKEVNGTVDKFIRIKKYRPIKK